MRLRLKILELWIRLLNQLGFVKREGLISRTTIDEDEIITRFREGGVL
jgi:hypothetical protein